MHFQNDIVHGVFAAERADNAPILAAVAATQRAIVAARAAGILVIHVVVAYSPGHPEANPHAPLFRQIRDLNVLVAGTWSADIVDDLAPAPGDIVITNTGMSALAGTPLASILRARGIRRLLLTGISTNGVVESTARAAVDDGFAVVILRDGCASNTAAANDASLRLLTVLGESRTVDGWFEVTSDA